MKMIFRKGKKEELEYIVSLYDSVKGDALCVWSDVYPTMFEAEEDEAIGNLYVVELDNKIVACASIVPVNEMDHFDEWQVKDDVAEIGRVVVDKNYRGMKIGKFLLESIIDEIRNRGYNSIHLSTAIINIPAQKNYERLGFKTVGTKYMWGNDYFLCEKILKEDINENL